MFEHRFLVVALGSTALVLFFCLYTLYFLRSMRKRYMGAAKRAYIDGFTEGLVRGRNEKEEG